MVTPFGIIKNKPSSDGHVHSRKNGGALITDAKIQLFSLRVAKKLKICKKTGLAVCEAYPDWFLHIFNFVNEIIWKFRNFAI